MKDETITAYITKYALTVGIMEREATVIVSSGGTMIEVEIPAAIGFAYTHFFHGGDWHRTREAAVSKALEMRARKVKSLRKQLAKLEDMSFA